MGKVAINGTDLKGIGFGTLNARAWWDGLSAEFRHQTPYQTYSSVRGSGFFTTPRNWPLTLMLREPVQATRESKLDALRRLFAASPAEVDTLRFESEGDVAVTVEGSSRVQYVVYRGDEANPPGGLDWLRGDAEVVLDLVAYDAAKYNAAADTQGISAATQIAMGTLPSHWSVSIAGAATNPELIVYADNGGAQGAEIWRLTLVAAVAGGETLTIDGLLQRVLLDSVDITETALPLDAATRFQLLDGVEDGLLWVNVTGGGTNTLTWRKRWR